MYKYIYLIQLCLFLSLISCNSSQTKQKENTQSDTATTDNQPPKDHNQANKHMHKHKFEDLVKNFESADRANWQKPEEVIKKLGNIKGKTVMDIGSGTGYFSFKLVEAGAKVIAADVNKKFREFIRQKQKERNVSEDQLRTLKLPYDSPRLASEEVDAVIIVNTYHHIENRKKYFNQVLEGLKSDGKLLVVDFKKEKTPHGPPLKMRLTVQEVKKELQEAGFSQVEIDMQLLPYQYTVLATK